ncbi:glycoside hydrolase, family 32 [Tanacetum coccineum]
MFVSTNVLQGNIPSVLPIQSKRFCLTPLDPAIEPSESFDRFGCSSGSATVLPDEKPVILYTGIINEDPKPGYQVQNYAIPENYSDPYLTKWIQTHNPILKPTKENVAAFRDPSTAWKLNDQWEMTIGSKKENVGMWECPDFYPVSTTSDKGLDATVIDGDIKHVFKVSLDLTRFDCYRVGKYDTEQDKYIPDEGMIDGWAGLRYDWGNFYASKFDPQRTVGSSGDGLTSLALRMKTLGKDGLESRFTLIPRTVWLDPSGKQLLLWPFAELETLRDQNVQLSNMELKQGDKVEVEGITAAQADVDVVFIFLGLDKAETYDTKWDKIFPPETLAENICQVMGTTVQVLMCSDAMPSTLNNQEYKPSSGGFVDIDLADNKISLRTLIDHSVVGSFAAGERRFICVWRLLGDVGNNNYYLPLSLAKADYRPNGVDYSSRKSTGRFSNGKNAADFLAKKMGLPSSPPYLSMIGTTPPITGVSFASGASGILNETGVNFLT